MTFSYNVCHSDLLFFGFNFFLPEPKYPAHQQMLCHNHEELSDLTFLKDVLAKEGDAIVLALADSRWSFFRILTKKKFNFPFQRKFSRS